MAKLYAHRCISNIYIENFLELVKEVLIYEFIYGIELDVRMSKGKKIVILHNPDITLVSNGASMIYDLTLEQLYKYGFFINTLEIKKYYL